MREFYKPILSERNIEPLIKFFIKKWDKELTSGEIPRFNLKEVQKLGLFEYQKEIRHALVDYYIDNYQGQQESLIEKSIEGKTYTTTDIANSGIDVGNYDFEFKITGFKIIDTNITEPNKLPSITAQVEFVITIGEVTVWGGDNSVQDLTNPINKGLDYWWEVLGEIKDMIGPFLKQVVLEFGLKLEIYFLTNQTYEKNALVEGTKEDVEMKAKRFLDSLKLENWHSKSFGMEYLATKKGTILILIDKYGCSIQEQIYEPLISIFSNNEDSLLKFIVKYLKTKDVSIAPGFNQITSSSAVGTIDFDDKDDVKGPRSQKKNIQEAKGKMLPKNKFAKEYLSRFNNLKKYRSADGDYIYLANNSGKIIVQNNTTMNETGVDDRIWGTLEIYFNEREARRKIISWLLDEYQLSNIGYVYKSRPSVLDNIGLGDTLIEKDQITESEDKNQLKDFFFKKWSKQKELGQTPKLSSKEINRLGLSKFKNEIILHYGEFMGLDPEKTNRRSEVIKHYLLNSSFDEKDMPIITEWLDQGKMEFKIDSVEFIENDGYLDVDIDFTILRGSFYNDEEGTTMSFSSDEGFPFDDMMEHFEFQDQIKEIIQNFIGETLENFGFNLSRNKDIGSINVNLR